MYLKAKDILNFNVDYIDLYGYLIHYNEITKWLDSDNSNYRLYKWFVIEKNINVDKYLEKLTFSYQWIPVFAWYLWDPTLFIPSKNSFTVYGWAFNLFSVQEIVNFIQENLSPTTPTWFRIKRLDIALDIRNPIKKIYKNFNKRKWKGSEFFDETGTIQTFYIWEYKKASNKNMLIRVYDKIADIKQKEKQLFYPDYLKLDNVTRIEIEFRSELLKYLKLEQLLDKDFLYKIFTNYISKKTKLFDKIKDESTEKFKRDSKEVDISELRYNEIMKTRYINSFVWYAKKFLLLWSCPIDTLLQYWLIRDLTQQDIWNSVCLNDFELAKYRQTVYERTWAMYSVKDLFSNQWKND